MSLFFQAMLICLMSHVNFTKGPGRCVDFKGQGPEGGYLDHCELFYYPQTPEVTSHGVNKL